MTEIKELMARMRWARIWEAKDPKENNENMIRIYLVQHPDVFAFQIRTFKPITDRSRKSRNMIAHVQLSLTEMEEILDFMKACTGKSPRINTEPLERIEK